MIDNFVCNDGVEDDYATTTSDHLSINLSKQLATFVHTVGWSFCSSTLNNRNSVEESELVNSPTCDGQEKCEFDLLNSVFGLSNSWDTFGITWNFNYGTLWV